MTPQEYLDQISALVSAERWREALAFADTGFDEVWPVLSGAEIDRINGMMEVAFNIVQLLDQDAQAELTTPPHADTDVSAGRT